MVTQKDVQTQQLQQVIHLQNFAPIIVVNRMQEYDKMILEKKLESTYKFAMTQPMSTTQKYYNTIMPLCIVEIKEQMLIHKVEEELHLHKLQSYQAFLDFIYMPSSQPTYSLQCKVSPL